MFGYIIPARQSVIVGQSGRENFYLYDANGSPIGMQYREPTMGQGVFYTFWFEKNLQGDIVAVYNETGTKLISYAYDAWGNFRTTTHNHSGTNAYAAYNPFRYRGYYYDDFYGCLDDGYGRKIGFYYLNSRYYNPQWGRFINADGQLNGGLLGYNMFAYCNNNPVMNIDPDGNFFISMTVICIVGLALAGAAAGGYGGYAYAKNNDIADEDMWKYIAGGATLGAVAGATVGAIVAPAVSAATGIAGINVSISAGITVVGTGGSVAAAAESVTALQTYYPPNDGFSGAIEKVTLNAGTLLQRTGSLFGYYVAPYGTPSQMLSLPYDKIGEQATVLQVMSSLEVTAGRVAPWFGQIGGGTQYLLNQSVQELINQGVIKIFGG